MMNLIRNLALLALMTVCSFAQNNLNDFRPTGGGATLSVNVTGGVAAIGTTPTAISGKNVALSANATNYVFVDLVGGTITSNTSGFTSTTYPIAIAITNATQVTSLTDSRPGAYATSASSSVALGIVSSGLIAQYAFTDNSGTTLTDSSGTGNNGTLCGAAPAWVGAPTGGLTFTAASSQCVTLPSALNASATIQVFGNFQVGSLTGSASFACIIAGNGGTKANTNALCQNDSGATGGFSNTGTYFDSELMGIKGAATFGTANSATIGTALTTWVLDATTDILYTGTNSLVMLSTTGSAGNQTSGVYQLGGIGSGYINGNSSFWSGTLYYALFYNRKLTVAEIAQNNNAINQVMANRSFTFIPGSTLAAKNVYIIDGDSLPGAAGAWTQYAFPSTADGTWQAFYTGKGGWGIVDLLVQGAIRDDVYCPIYPGTGQCILNVQIGTNNIPVTLSTYIPQYSQFIAQRRATGKYSQIWINTVIDKTGASAGKNALNTALLQSWQSMGATGIIPIGEDPNLGCDGCNTNAFFNVDHIHPSSLGQYEIAHIQQPNINRATNGNFNFTSANTYTTTAATATTITAATESTNTVTLTFSATPGAFVPGVDLTITGVTPAGYNTSASNVCHVLTATGTQVTCLNSATGLAAGSVFGTAATPMQLDVDAAVILAGAATTPSFTLQSCGSFVGGGNVQGWDGRLRIKNANTTSPWTITPFGAETIDGAASLAMPTASSGNNPVVILEAQALAASTGGCNWRRLQ